MYYIQSESNDPYYNLALEQVVFDKLDRSHSYFMLWQNDNTIVVGKHQNTAAEINAAYVKENGINVVRRLSGGGAVYHDLGNLNFTFVVDGGDGAFDFATFCRPVAAALGSLGVEVEISGRNDMTIDGKKFSGNSQYRKQGRVMHHGTILFDSDLTVVAGALNVPADKIQSKGIQSVKSRVTNVKPYLKEGITTIQFRDALKDYMTEQNNMLPYTLTAEEQALAHKLRDEIYSTWEWNFGASPAHSIQKVRRIEGCGRIEVYMDVAKQGVLTAVEFYGDFFSGSDPAELAQKLIGCKLEQQELDTALRGVDVGSYFANLQTEQLIEILVQ